MESDKHYFVEGLFVIGLAIATALFFVWLHSAESANGARERRQERAANTGDRENLGRRVARGRFLRAMIASNDRSIRSSPTPPPPMSDSLADPDSPSLPPAAHIDSREDFLASLNAQQRLAVEHGTGSPPSDNGPLLIIAGAGSGKTSTLAHRVAHLVRHGADPQRILLLTFSRRAAADMERRATHLVHRALGARQAKGARRGPGALQWAGTFHSVGARLLREYAARIGLAESFSILDRGDAEDLLAIVRNDLDVDVTKRRFPTKATCLAIYSRVVNSEATLLEVLERQLSLVRSVGGGVEAALRRLRRARSRRRTCSTTTTSCSTGRTWSREPSLARQIGERFDHVLVDEYQDTNGLQASILLALKPDGRGVTVVGDDAQSIYSFRAATVRNILDFPGRFTPPARVVTLERNYRSTQPILDASNAVIDLARERFTKNLWTERVSSAKPRLVAVRDEADQARCVAERVLERREQGMALTVAGGAVSQLQPQRAARDRARAPRHSVRQVRRPQISRSVACEGRARGGQVGRQSAQPDGRLSRREPRSRHRVGDGEQAPRRARGIAGRVAGAGGVQDRAVGHGGLDGVPRRVPRASRSSRLLARGARARHPVVRTASRTPVRRRAGAPEGSRPASSRSPRRTRRASASSPKWRSTRRTRRARRRACRRRTTTT